MDNYTPLAPTDILLDNLSIYENRMGENILNVTGIDPNEDELTYVVFQSRDGVIYSEDMNILKLKGDVIKDYHHQITVLNFLLTMRTQLGLLL